MRYLNKALIFILVIMLTFLINVSSWSVPMEYEQPYVELRGAWVSTVSNIDIGQQTSIENYQQQYTKILNNFEKFNMNAVFFQVRPTNDAFYKSEINPWSEFLTGQQGKDPGWDPLPWLIEETHKRGMEFHAWLNPYRASLDVFSSETLTDAEYQTQLSTALAKMSSDNFAKKHPELLIQGGNRILLNPGKQEVRQHIYDTIEEIIVKYDVDAIHFDDYFYTDVNLNADKELYMADSGATSYVQYSHKDWRRKQVDLLVEGVHNLIEDFNEVNNKNIQFGISPAAGWAPSNTECLPPPTGYGMEGGMEGYSCWGYSSYHNLYADTRKWVKEEWLDYILPQNYFELGRMHEEITDWWSRQVEGTSVKLYMGLGVYQYRNYSYLTANEYANQLKFNQQYKNVQGIVIFSYKDLISPISTNMRNGVENIKKIWTITPLLPFGLTGEKTETKAINPNLVRKNQSNEISFTTTPQAYGYAIYRKDEGQSDFNIIKILKNNADTLQYKDSVENDKKYEYKIKAVLYDGSISNNEVFLKNNNNYVPSAPVIKITSMTKLTLLKFNEKFNLQFEVSDADNDEVTITIEYATYLDRYRYDVTVPIENGKVNYDFEIPSVETNTGMIRITASDITDKTYYYTQKFIVVGDIGLLESYLYLYKNQIDDMIQDIIG